MKLSKQQVEMQVLAPRTHHSTGPRVAVAKRPHLLPLHLPQAAPLTDLNNLLLILRPVVLLPPPQLGPHHLNPVSEVLLQALPA